MEDDTSRKELFRRLTVGRWRTPDPWGRHVTWSDTQSTTRMLPLFCLTWDRRTLKVRIPLSLLFFVCLRIFFFSWVISLFVLFHTLLLSLPSGEWDPRRILLLISFPLYNFFSEGSFSPSVYVYRNKPFVFFITHVLVYLHFVCVCLCEIRFTKYIFLIKGDIPSVGTISQKIQSNGQ